MAEAAANGSLSKRQRRPSVRLGEIGEQPASAIPLESYLRRCKQYNVPLPSFPHHPPKPSRPLPHKRSRPSRPIKPEEPGELDCCSDDLRWGDSGSPLEDHSPSDDAGGLDPRVRAGKDEPSETGGRSWGRDDDGVRSWLEGLGLGRYAPMFEIHEVDEEVLPFLTLEDLKEMGIPAVGTRRKIFSAIRKLERSSD